MNYPPYPLSRAARLSIMFALIAVFFIVTPLVLLYTIGYQYDFDTRQVLQTGSMSIDVAPREAKIYVNDRQIRRGTSLFPTETLTGRPTPLGLPNLRSQNYVVRAEAPGYLPWEARLDVHSKQTSYIRNITLITDEAFQVSALSPTPTSKIQASTQGQFLAYIHDTSSTRTVVLHDILQNTTNVLFESAASNTLSLAWSPYAEALIIEEQVQSNSSTILRLFSNENDFALSQNFFGTYDHYQWDVSGQSRLYIAQDNQIYQLSADGSQAILSAQPTSSVWFVDTNQDIWSVSPQDSLIVNEQQGIAVSIDGAAIIDQMLFATNRGLLFRSTNGEIGLLSFTGPDQVAGILLFPNAKDIYVGDNAWYVTNRWDVWEIARDFTVTEIYKTSNPVVSVTDVVAYNMLVISQEDKTQLFFPEHITTVDIAHPTTLRLLAVDREERQFIFVDEAGVMFIRGY